MSIDFPASGPFLFLHVSLVSNVFPNTVLQHFLNELQKTRMGGGRFLRLLQKHRVPSTESIPAADFWSTGLASPEALCGGAAQGSAPGAALGPGAPAFARCEDGRGAELASQGEFGGFTKSTQSQDNRKKKAVLGLIHLGSWFWWWGFAPWFPLNTIP